MQITRTITTVEVHTGGEPFCIVTSGLHKAAGTSIVQRRAWLRENADDIIDGAPRHEGSTQANCCIFADREVDRSPTGSRTAGRVAQLYLRGKLGKDDVLVNESVIGTLFEGKVLTKTQVGDIPAVVPEISGTAHICGFATWVLDERDPLKNGFLVR